MALRGKKPEAVQKRLKVLFWGKEGTGKTTCAISFPKPYVIDTEKGAENEKYEKIIKETDGVVFQTSDFDELYEEVKQLLTVKHDYQTLVIDSLTLVYYDLVAKAEKKVGTEFGRHYGEADKAMKKLFNMLLRLDMNVIVTCQAKNEYGPNLTLIGETFDCYKKLGYMFDLVFQVQKRGADRIGIVKKSRVTGFEDGDNFTFSYEFISNTYGRDALQHEVIPEILATQEQVVEINRLIDLLHIDAEVVSKWLDKANAFSLEDMSTTSIKSCIDFLNKKIKE